MIDLYKLYCVLDNANVNTALFAALNFKRIMPTKSNSCFWANVCSHSVRFPLPRDVYQTVSPKLQFLVTKICTLINLLVVDILIDLGYIALKKITFRSIQQDFVWLHLDIAISSLNVYIGSVFLNIVYSPAMYVMDNEYRLHVY